MAERGIMENINFIQSQSASVYILITSFVTSGNLTKLFLLLCIKWIISSTYLTGLVENKMS